MMSIFIQAFKNWRALVLCALSLLAIIAVLANGEDLVVFVAYKLTAVALIVLIYWLTNRWTEQGYLEELDEILKDD